MFPKARQRRLLLLLLLPLLAIGLHCSPLPPEEEEEEPGHGLSFEDALEANPAGFFVGEATNLVLRGPVELQSGWTMTSMWIYSVTADGDSLANVGRALDNGDLDVYGDEVAGDGVYSGILSNLAYTEPQTLHLRMLGIAQNGEGVTRKVWSSTLAVLIAEPAEQAELDRIVADMGALEADFAALVDGGTDPADARDQLLTWLAGRPGVSSAQLAPDGNTVWAVYERGLTAGAFLTAYDDGPVLGAPSRGRGGAAEDAGYSSSPSPFRAARSLDEVQTNRALVLSPFHTWLEGLSGDPCPDIAEMLGEAECPSFVVELRQDGQADAAAFTRLDDFGGLCIVTHGTRAADGQVCLATGQLADLPALEEWFWDLYGDDPGLVILSVDGSLRLAVTDAFIAGYNDNFPNTLVTLGACQSLADGGLAATLLEVGAGYVCGFDGVVGVEYGTGAIRNFWMNLVGDGLDAGGAHDSVDPQSDPGHEFTAFVESGNRQIYFSEGLANGGFEQGSLAGWIPAGDARVLVELGETLPRGETMAIISTGLMGGGIDFGSIEQQLCLSPATESLELEFDLYSEEFLEFCGGNYQDHFEVLLVDEGGEEILYAGAIDDFCGGVTPSEVVFDVGPSGEPGDPYYDPVGVYHTGWTPLSLPISHHAGDTVILRIRIQADGDASYHSALLLDEIAIVETP